MKSKWKQRKKKSVFTEKDNNTINAIVVSYNDKYNDIYNSVIDHYNDKDIEYYTDISQYIPYTIIIAMKSSVYMESLDIMQYTKLKLMILDKLDSLDSIKIILHGSLYDAIDTVKSVPNQMMNKLYRYILKSLYQYDKRFFTDLIELNILEELSFSNKIYNKDFNYDKDSLTNNKVCALCDTKKDYIDILSNKYSISDIHQILNLSELTVMTNYPEPVLHRIGYDRNVERYIYSMSYYEWIQHLKLYSEDAISKSPLLKFVKDSLQESLGMPFNEIIALTIKPVSIARLYTYNSSFDPSIDEIIEDNID